MGGGSGGHVTPVVAVVSEIWKIRPRAKVEFWTDRKYFRNARKITIENGMKLKIKKVAAGKLRRYTNFKLMDYLEHFDVVLLNVWDGFRLIFGFLQSLVRLLFLKPNVIFLKGGYTCLPVGLAARLLRIPYVIHDSDAVPGLTNRVLAGCARRIATGMPLEYYNYPTERAVWTGIPIGEEFRAVSESRQKALKKELGFREEKLLVVVTGGSQGAEHINLAMREILPALLEKASVLLVAGRARYDEMLDLKKYETWENGELKSNFRMIEFSSEMYKLFGAADVVVSRAGASTMTELAKMGKAVVMVPYEKLPGFHQVKNAEAYEAGGAAIVVFDDKMNKEPKLLLEALEKVLGKSREKVEKREELGKNLRKFAKANAAEELAKIVVEVGSR